MNRFYTYILLNPNKKGRHTYADFITLFYEPFYIGKGTSERIIESVQEKGKTYKPQFIQKIKLLGLEPISFKLINAAEEKCAFCFEKYLIALIGRNDLGLGPLTNLTDGGEGGSGSKSDATKKKISLKNTGKKRSKEFKQLMSLQKKGKRTGPMSASQKEKISFKNKGRKLGPQSEDHRKKISESLMGKSKEPMPIITKKKIHESLIGEKSPWFGKRHSNATLQKLRECKIGNLNFLGKRHTEETKQAMREKRKIYYTQKLK